ncbi:hypothetical protein [Salinibacter phage M8CRM-1]|uniref:Holin of 3TMs, for gene-transfer release n=3 Tax=Kryptosalinivirus TaxID=2560163 RepID=A0A2I6UG69_9CAUD|nr:holin [Salinibacter phage M8CC-19]YP_009639498.1 holin [Salinibacter phage M8CRM-1]AUO78975.1 hypothetical protein [Salinibacter phage M8CC-19]AUO79135.1 hypothetical protein [Salinibacter phage M8CRM-1]AUO79209.1 hypothetical protein [Salinibacter phage M31CC-1]
MDWPIIGTIKSGFNAVRGIIDDVDTSDEERAKALAKLEQIQNDATARAQKHAETMLKLRTDTIRSEAESEDPWTSRARPMFMYVMYLVIVVNVLVAPTVGVFYPDQMSLYFTHIGKGFKAIPGEVWATFTAGYLGYAGFRTYEKKAGVAGKGKNVINRLKKSLE